MPYSIRKVPKKSCYRLTNRDTKKVFAKCTSLANAQSQLRLLNALKYNKSFVPGLRPPKGGRNRKTAKRKHS